MITAPYNFVPLNEKVVMPFWAKHISQDIPFKNSQSGVLKLKIKAESPIYVRNGSPRNWDKEDPRRNNFNHLNGDCFIPGSSIKGMLRSVVEIMSFGRMKNKVNPDKYSVRDFQNNKIYPKTDLSNKVECGWLYKIGDEYFIDKCGKPGRISHKNLDRLCNGQKISTYYKTAQNVRTDRDKSAKSKNDKFNFTREQKFSSDYEDMGRKVYKLDANGTEGTIVMTGQSSVRKEPNGAKASGKHLEFIFWKKAPTKTPVSDEIIKNFFFAYYDHDKNSQKEDWEWRKPKLDRGEKIPVFYRTHQVNGKQEFQDIGLTMLFKITYHYSILDAINNQQEDSDSYDLAEAIFGYVNDKKALKGRVHVGHAFVSNGKPNPLGEKTEVLAGPKASYYPNYIEQNPNANGQVGNYNTFMNQNAKIRGWKRYPVHKDSEGVHYELPKRGDGSINYDVVTKFIPLPTSTEFELNIAYHNLRKEELGALISAITFHNTDGLFHSIGSAKPLGYGKIKLTIEGGLTKDEQIEAMKAYEAYMDYALGNSTPLWFQSEQIKELFAMAKPGNEDIKLKYMELTDFVNAKGRRRGDPQYALQKYSVISKNNVLVNSLITKENLDAVKTEYQQELNSFDQLNSIPEQKQQRLIQTEQNLQNKLEILKSKLINELTSKQNQIQEQEKAYHQAHAEKQRLENRNEKQEIAKARGLVLENFNVMDRNAFNNLSKEIINYAKDLHNKNENRLKRDLGSQPWVQESDFDLIRKAIIDIFKHLPNQKEIEKWKADFENNHVFRKVAQWVGLSKAESFYSEIMKS